LRKSQRKPGKERSTKKRNEEDRYISVDTEVYRPNSFDALAQFDLSIETVSIEEQRIQFADIWIRFYIWTK